MKFNDLAERVLNEKSTEKTLYLYYDIDINMKGGEEGIKNFHQKKRGEAKLTKKEINNTQSVEDLVDLMRDKKLFNDAVKEIIVFFFDATQEELKEGINPDDKIYIEIDFGETLNNSTGFKINKRAGSNSLTIMMKRNGEVLAGQFSEKLINKQILFFRNNLMVN